MTEEEMLRNIEELFIGLSTDEFVDEYNCLFGTGYTVEDVKWKEEDVEWGEGNG